MKYLQGAGKKSKEVPDEVVKLIEDSIIPGTKSSTSGYAHKIVSCKLKESDAIRKVGVDVIAAHLDDYRYNFGIPNAGLSSSAEKGLLFFKAKIYTD